MTFDFIQGVLMALDIQHTVTCKRYGAYHFELANGELVFYSAKSECRFDVEVYKQNPDLSIHADRLAFVSWLRGLPLT